MTGRSVLKRLSPFVGVALLVGCADAEPEAIKELPPAEVALAQIPTPFDDELLRTDLDGRVAATVEDTLANPWVAKVVESRFAKWTGELSVNRYRSRAIRVGPTQLGWLHRLVEQASAAFEIEVPAIFLVRDDEPLAYVTNAEQPTLVLHSELLRLLNRRELLFVIAHELGHVRAGHVRLLDLSRFLLSALELAPEWVGGAASLAMVHWRRAADLTADRYGYFAVGDAAVVSGTLLRLLSGLSRDVSGELDVGAFREQRRLLVAEGRDPELSEVVAEARTTVPFVATRIEAIDEWLASAEFESIRETLREVEIALGDARVVVR